MKPLWCGALMAVLLLLPCVVQSCSGTKMADKTSGNRVAKKSSNPQDHPKSGESTGTATMTSDGAIVLDLRATAADGTIGEARLVYPKDHKQYSEVLKHLGGLKPGESKPVAPWPDER